MAKSKGVFICVTNDLSYDQRMQRIGTSLLAAEFGKIGLIGRRRAQHYQDPEDDLMRTRFLCFFNKGIAFYLEYNLRLFLFLINNAKKYDIIYCCDPDTILGGIFAAKLLGKKAIYDSHEWFGEVPELQNKPIKKAIWKSVEQFGVNGSQLHLTVAPLLATKLEEKYGKSFEVIRNVPEYHAEDVDLQRKNTIIYQGALNKGRGLECFLDVADRLPSYEFWIVGDGDIRQKLEQKTKDLALSNVTFFGKKTPSELGLLTPKAKYGYNLLDDSSLNYEYSLANKFFDYASAGVVSINNRFPEYTNLIHKYQHGILVDALNPDEIAKKILEISEEDRQLMGVNGLKMIVENNWAMEEIKLIQLVGLLLRN